MGFSGHVLHTFSTNAIDNGAEHIPVAGVLGGMLPTLPVIIECVIGHEVLLMASSV
jgi:hypothetical protein